MKISWVFNQSQVDWQELSELYRIAPLGEKPANDLKLVFANSRYSCFIYDNQTLIGAGRALADGLDCSYICDVAIHPDYQGIGLGKQIINYLVNKSNGHKKIILYANPGKEVFYRKLGFYDMNTAMAIFDNHTQAINTGLLHQ